MQLREQKVRANGLDFSVLETGGPAASLGYYLATVPPAPTADLVTEFIGRG